MNLKPIIITIFVLLMCGTASAAWANTSYTYAKNIALHGADTQLSNYPYLVSVAKEPGMQSDYDDLIFYDQPVSQDGNPIDFEIETYNSTTATVWLNITTLPTAGKTISVYYGNSGASSTQNPTAVWDSDYVGVWHMSDNATAGYAWNNYKQPNGVLDANESTSSDMIMEPNVYYDGEFKLWFTVREYGNDSLSYWTSPDGYNWVLQDNCTIPNTRSRHAFVMKDPNSSGYWCYNMNESTSKEDLYYGTTETDWSLDTYGIFSASDVGGATMIGNVFVWRENTSDWYMICENNGPTWTSDYATSNDGKSWTFHGQIVVSGFGSNSLSGPYVHKNNGTYYLVFHGNKEDDGGIPSDIYVATSTDRQSWTYQPGFEITREYQWEGAGDAAGQDGDPHLVEYNNEVYIYYTGRENQGVTFIRLGLVHLNESFQELCDHIDAGISGASSAADSTSNNRDGSLTNINTSTNSAIGSCMEFNGISSYIDFGTPIALPTATHEWWVNASTITATSQQPYTYNLLTGEAPMVVQRFIEDTSVDKMRGQVGTWFDNIDASPDTYYYIAIISDASGTDTWYVNGAQVGSKAHATNYSDDTSRWAFGTSRNSEHWYGGTVDEGRVSDMVRSADWINLSYKMVVDGSYVTFGAEETSGGGGNTIVLGANKYGMLRKSVTSAQSFSTIAGEFSHDICFTWWDSTNDRWESYYSGDSYNSAKSVPEHDSYFVLMDGTGETVSCSVAAAENVNIPIGWSSTYLRESTSKTLSAIKTDMGSNCADVYAWDHTASGTGAWTNTGTFSVLPNQGILVDASSGFTWDGTVS